MAKLVNTVECFETWKDGRKNELEPCCCFDRREELHRARVADVTCAFNDFDAGIHLSKTEVLACRKDSSCNKSNAEEQLPWLYSTFRIGSKEDIYAAQGNCFYVMNAQDEVYVDVHLSATKESACREDSCKK